MEKLHGYMIEEKDWVTYLNGKMNSVIIDNSAYKIIRLNWPRILDDAEKQNVNRETDKWFLEHREIMEMIPEEKRTELGIPIDIFDENNFFYIVYQEQEGIKLSMDDVNSLEMCEKIDVLLKVSSALKTLHDNGIVHGDINPGCIEIYRGYDNSIQVQILGFENFFFENRKSISPGTYSLWMSPEMALYHKCDSDYLGSDEKYLQYISLSTDIFSLGLIFHQYCSDSGLLPICTKDYPWQEFFTGSRPLVVVNGGVEEIISKMIEAEPGNRPSIDVIIQNLYDIRDWLDIKPIKTEELSEMKEDIEKSVDSGCIEQDMLCDEEFYDLIFVINKAELTKGWLKDICDNVSRFTQRLPFRLLEAKKVVLPIRAKIIWYGDIYLDGDNAIGESKYYWLLDDLCSFEQYIQSEKPIPGCEKPESGIEALCLATELLADSKAKFGTIILCSELGAYDIEMLQGRGVRFTSTVRPVNTCEFISGWNDDYVEPAHPLGYVEKIKDFSEHDITKWRYCGCTSENRFLILYTPPKYPWSEFEYELERCIRVERFEDALEYAMEYGLERFEDVKEYGVEWFEGLMKY